MAAGRLGSWGSLSFDESSLRLGGDVTEREDIRDIRGVLLTRVKGDLRNG